MGLAGWRKAVVRVLERFARRTDGVSAIEFAIVAPIFLVIIAGTIDFGGVLYTKFTLNSGLSAASNYAFTQGDPVTVQAGKALVESAVKVLGGTSNIGIEAIVTINHNGPSSRLHEGVVTVSNGSSGGGDKCYCPQMVTSELVWGNAVECKKSCPDDTTSGKFIVLTISRNYTPMFPLGGYGVVQQGLISARAVVPVYMK